MLKAIKDKQNFGKIPGAVYAAISDARFPMIFLLGSWDRMPTGTFKGLPEENQEENFRRIS